MQIRWSQTRVAAKLASIGPSSTNSDRISGNCRFGPKFGQLWPDGSNVARYRPSVAIWGPALGGVWLIGANFVARLHGTGLAMSLAYFCAGTCGASSSRTLRAFALRVSPPAALPRTRVVGYLPSALSMFRHVPGCAGLLDVAPQGWSARALRCLPRLARARGA